MAVSVVTTAANSFGGVSPSVTFTGYVPALNDVVVQFPQSTAAMVAGVSGINMAADASLPAGWLNPLGDGVEVTSDAHSIGCLYHKVTAGEVSAVTTVYTATSALTLDPANGLSIGIVLRGVDPTTPIDSAGTSFNSGNTTTPHVLAGLTGANVSTGSLVVSCVGGDGPLTYTAPAGWTLHLQNSTFGGTAVLTRTALTTSGTNVSATNITPSIGDEYCSITLALTVASAPGTAAVYLGTTPVVDLFLGTTEITKVYMGTTEVYSA